MRIGTHLLFLQPQLPFLCYYFMELVTKYNGIVFSEKDTLDRIGNTQLIRFYKEYSVLPTHFSERNISDI